MTTLTQTYRQTKRKGNATKNIQSENAKNTQNDMNELLEFDMEGDFGPCIGLTRLQRWHRAQKYGLNPPQHIKDLIKANEDNPKYTECVWQKYNI